MSNERYEFSAKSVEEAIAEGLSALGLTREQADIEIVNKGNRGILGFGSEPAIVRITPRATSTPADAPPAPAEKISVESAATAAETASVPESAKEEEEEEEESAATADASADEASSQDKEDKAESEAEPPFDESTEDAELEALAVELLARVIDLMGFDVEIVSSWETPTEAEPYLNLDIRGDDLGVLIGRRGETLANIQFLLRLMVNQRMKAWKNVVVDVEQYKERRVQQLTQLANRMAEQVATGGRAMSLEPMPANERRIIHIALRDHPAVYTESTGEGERRKVAIIPR